jgi:hypothetical protein
MQIAEEKKAFTLHLPVNHLDQHLSGSLLSLRQMLPADGVACNRLLIGL